MKCITKEAYKLLHEGVIALAEIESNGIAIDVDYLKKAIVSVTNTIKEIKEQLKKDKIYKAWVKRFGDKANLNSPYQLGEVIFKVLKYPRVEELEEDDKEENDEAAFRHLYLPFLVDYFRYRKLEKAVGTYLKGIQRETVDGFIHPFFDLHSVVSYRSGSSAPNFQNMPARNKEVMELIRKCFIPRKNRRLVEIDFSGIEVRVACCVTKDPKLIEDFTTPGKDPHRDTASKLFNLDIDYLIQNKDWAKKTVRDWAKNRFVFPEFYGSVYFQCAPHIWEVASDERIKLPTSGISIKDYLLSKGITELGECDPKQRPRTGTFEAHVRSVEKDFWKVRFKVYDQWKHDWWENYLKQGGFQIATGFWVEWSKAGLPKFNNATNTPIQGPAFHCLLWCLIQLQKWLTKNKFKSKIVGQIHDSIVLDVVESELQDVLNRAYYLMSKKLLQHWEWIIVPMETETEITPIDSSWNTKEQWIAENGIWKKK